MLGHRTERVVHVRLDRDASTVVERGAHERADDLTLEPKHGSGVYPATPLIRLTREPFAVYGVSGGRPADRGRGCDAASTSRRPGHAVPTWSRASSLRRRCGP